MLRLRRISTILASGAVLAAGLMGLVGCNGPSPGLDPTITMEFDRNANWPSFPAGGTLFIKGTAKTEDETANPVVYARWTQDPPLGAFVLDSENALENVWKAPAEIAAPTRVNLVLTTRSLLGGESKTVVQLVVIPQGQIPIYRFNYAVMFPTGKAMVPEGSMLAIAGTGVTADPLDPIVSYEWTQDPEVGVFDNNRVANPLWSSPVLQVDPSTGLKQPVTVKLHVRLRTRNGHESMNSLLVNVVE